MSEYKYLLVPILAWVSVQLIKFITDVIKNKKINLKVLVASGGMPSSHSSVVTSLMTLIGINEGFDSILFAIALKLDINGLEKLLESASYSLPKNNKFDLIIRFCFIKKIYDINVINDLLYDYNLKTLN